MLLVLFLGGPVARLPAFELRAFFVTAMPTWIYNGFTRDGEGNNVQGSDVSPLRMTFGGGAEIALNERHRLEPQLWFYLQEYAALRDHDKTVPTQIETGVAVGDIANTLGIALSVPWLYTLPWPNAPGWRFSAGLGAALVFRIPIEEIDGSDGSEVGSYWISGRFIYPQVSLAADYQLNELYELGAGAEWYIPVYNAWAQEVSAPFLDETMVRLGLRIRRFMR
ncbi:MAG: hypothetical protein EA427_03850 [Spirochaetaceae bacterium]|nr:MAG: hypothetical protein EA427_03850 [Spirochaetaceae bacterium]